MSVGTDKFTSALDCNGFPLDKGDLVEMTELLDARHAGTCGVVADVRRPNICLVQLERQITLHADRAEILAAAGFLWKLIAKGAS